MLELSEDGFTDRKWFNASGFVRWNQVHECVPTYSGGMNLYLREDLQNAPSVGRRTFLEIMRIRPRVYLPIHHLAGEPAEIEAQLRAFMKVAHDPKPPR